MQLSTFIAMDALLFCRFFTRSRDTHTPFRHNHIFRIWHAWIGLDEPGKRHSHFTYRTYLLTYCAGASQRNTTPLISPDKCCGRSPPGLRAHKKLPQRLADMHNQFLGTADKRLHDTGWLNNNNVIQYDRQTRKKPLQWRTAKPSDVKYDSLENFS